MASNAMAAGELYFAGELDPRTQELTSYFKIGIVRESEDRSSVNRMKEHQTGNPRELTLIEAIPTPVVEQIETLMHGAFAPLRISGEWFFFSSEQRDQAIRQATEYALEANDSIMHMKRAIELEKVPSNDETLTPSDRAWELHLRLLNIRHEIKVLENATKLIDATIRDLSSSDVPLGRYATLGSSTESEKFDETKFKQDHPDLWSQLYEITPKWQQRFLLSETKEMKESLGETRSEIREITDAVKSQIQRAIDFRDIAPVHGEFLNVLTFLAPLEWEEKRLESELKAELGEYQEIEGICSWTRSFKDRGSLNKKVLQELHPEIYGKYVSKSQSKPKLTISRDCGFVH
jgi:hypothetical protein